MRFKKLRLAGFKSFVEPAELLIEPGLTGIVGPNGCGKSNLVEALQWAMGEGSARRLRGGEMDDVIFGGTGSRPARNIASVSLALDLTETETPAWLAATHKSNVPRLFAGNDPPDSFELDVERRIDRGKGSNYRVNGREVRARDVQILFADGASGSQSAALVGQGRIGWLIGAKPAERRALLEEAAGISGLQSRRHEAELKLSSTEQNLQRVDDQAASLAGQIEKLKKQARQAERYRKLSDEIRHIEALVLLTRHADTVKRVAHAQTRLDEAQRAVDAAEVTLKQASRRRANGGEALAAAQARSGEAGREAERLGGKLQALDAEQRRVIQQLTENQRRLDELKQDAAREAVLAEEAAAVLERLTAERRAVAADQAGDAVALAVAQAAVTRTVEELRAAEHSLSEAAAHAARQEAERNAVTRRRAGLEERHQRLAKQQVEALAQIQVLDGLVIAPDRLAAAQQATAIAEAEAAEAREALEAADDAMRQARMAENEALSSARRADQRKLQLSAEVKAISRLVEAETVNGFAPVLDAIKVKKGLEAAMGAVFGDDLLASLDPLAPGYWAAFDMEDEPPSLPADVTPGPSFVEAPAALGRCLNRLGLVKDSGTGERLQPSLKPGQMLVSSNGDVWRWDGLVRRPGASSAAAARLVHRNRLSELQEQLERAAGEFDYVEKAYQAAKLVLENAAAGEKLARDRLRAAMPLIAEARSAELALMQQAGAEEARRHEVAERQKRNAADLIETEAHLSEAIEELSCLTLAGHDQAETARLRQQFDEARSAERAAQLAADLVERDASLSKLRLATLDADFASSASRQSGACAQRTKLSERQARLQNERRALESRPAELEAERQLTAASLEEASRFAAITTDLLRGAEAEAQESERLAAAAAHALGQTREARVRAEAGQAQAEEALAGIEDRIWDAFGCTPVILGRRGSDFGPGPDAANLEDCLEKLKRDRDAIGAVNLMAESELNQLAEEYGTIERETNDLRAAILRLRQAIRELNQEGRERLLAAFKTVNSHFQDLFVRLFGGGRAELILTGDHDDPLQAGLEIMASPPGKKLQTLSLLSGGERALTALALVFAMFLTNPAPICVLDEVDAPLDDANVERFCKLVRHIGERTATRFLIITHHRVTMARMDRLYGVTMIEKGISRLVSVALKEAEVLRESA